DHHLADCCSKEKEVEIVIMPDNSCKRTPLDRHKEDIGTMWISLLKEGDFFPFLRNDIPFSAKATIAYLCFQFIDKMEIKTLDSIYKLLRILEIPVEEQKAEAEKLLDYSYKEDLLIMRIVASKPIFYLSKKCFKEILNITIKDESSIEKTPPLPFYEEMERKIREEKARKKAAVIPETCISNLVLEKEAMLKVQFIVALMKKDPSSIFRILLWGPPGTGKTFTAHAIAGELKKKLVTLDLANILDKYVGESEKKISSIFSDAAKEKAIILIDEADSYLRSRTNYSQDWWSNLVNHILKLIEKTKASVILCTNLYEKLDQALLRRMDEIIEYKIPQKEERFQIWQKEMEKHQIDKSICDLNEISSIEITGGLISNAVRKLQRIILVSGETEKIDTNFIKTLAEDERKKMGIYNPSRRIFGFGGLYDY
ncbi:MAG: AAA family ATPase, partial [Acidobacteria bacterium]|nr:AAA family ATPase [Acidobacteriota bacterium]